MYGAPETFLHRRQRLSGYRHVGDLNARWVWESELKPLWDRYSREAAYETVTGHGTLMLALVISGQRGHHRRDAV